jgi:hypothetical protein
MKRGTKESRFMIELYEQAKETGTYSTVFSAEKIAEKVGVNRTALRCADPLQHQFLKKRRGRRCFLNFSRSGFCRRAFKQLTFLSFAVFFCLQYFLIQPDLNHF